MSTFSETVLDPGIVVVDASNVCRDHALPPPEGLHRLDLVVGAWRAEVCRHAEFQLVADTSLLKRLPVEDLGRVERMRFDGDLTVVPDADRELLARAERHGAYVLSRDRFLDKRPGRHWAPERFFAWEVREGLVRIVPRPSRNTQAFDVSRAVEQKAVSARGIRRPDHAAVRRRWACVSEVPCITRAVTPQVLEVLPIVRRKIACCPGCGAPLHDLGERPPEAELKLVIDHVVRLRFKLAPGNALTFGRLVLPDTVELAELARDGAFEGVGRRHVELLWDGSCVAARPVDADHSVRRYAWDKQRRQLARRARKLPSTAFTVIGLRDHLKLGNRVVLLRSGRSIAEAEELARLADAAPWQASRTGGP